MGRLILGIKITTRRNTSECKKKGGEELRNTRNPLNICSTGIKDILQGE